MFTMKMFEDWIGYTIVIIAAVLIFSWRPAHADHHPEFPHIEDNRLPSNPVPMGSYTTIDANGDLLFCAILRGGYGNCWYPREVFEQIQQGHNRLQELQESGELGGIIKNKRPVKPEPEINLEDFI